MLDELDAMAAAARAADRAAARRRPRHVQVKAPTKVKITYWSQAEHRLKTRWTTCMFK